MKEFVPQLSRELFDTKRKIEKELEQRDKINENFYNLINKTIDFLKNKRKGAPTSKKLQYTNSLKRIMI